MWAPTAVVGSLWLVRSLILRPSVRVLHVSHMYVSSQSGQEIFVRHTVFLVVVGFVYGPAANSGVCDGLEDVTTSEESL